MASSVFAEIPIDVDRKYDFKIDSPENGELVPALVFVSGSFNTIDQSTADMIIRQSHESVDFDALMNGMIKCTKRNVVKDRILSVGFEKEYRLFSFTARKEEGSNVIIFNCWARNVDDGANFLWFRLYDQYGNGPFQSQVVKVKSDANFPVRDIIAEYTQSNHALLTSEFFNVLYNTIVEVSNKRTETIDVPGQYAEFIKFLEPNKNVMFTWSDHLMQCILKRASGEYIFDLTNEEAEKFVVRLDVRSFSGSKQLDRQSLTGVDAIACTPDYYDLKVGRETHRILLFQEFIPKIFAEGATHLAVKFLVYYNNALVGWSSVSRLRVSDKLISSGKVSNLGSFEKEKIEETKNVFGSLLKSLGVIDAEEQQIAVEKSSEQIITELEAEYGRIHINWDFDEFGEPFVIVEGSSPSQSLNQVFYYINELTEEIFDAKETNWYGSDGQFGKYHVWQDPVGKFERHIYFTGSDREKYFLQIEEEKGQGL